MQEEIPSESPENIQRKESAQLCLPCCCLTAGTAGVALPFGQDGRESRSLPWDVPGAEQEEKESLECPCDLSSFPAPLPCAGITRDDVCRTTTASPHFPVFSRGFPPILPAQRVTARRSPAATALTPSSSPWQGLKAASLSSAFVPEGTGSPGSFLAGLREEGLLQEQMVPVQGSGPLCQQLEGGNPLSPLGWGRAACLSHGQLPAECLYGITLLFI